MASVRLTSLTGLESFLRVLSRSSTVHDLNNRAGKAMVEEVNRGFVQERAPDGTPWIPSRAAQREGRKTLHKSGRLQNSITWLADTRGVILKTTGAANKYADIHQYGGTRVNHHGASGRFARRSKSVRTSSSSIPARPFLPGTNLPPSYKKAINKDVIRYMRERFGFS